MSTKTKTLAQTQLQSLLPKGTRFKEHYIGSERDYQGCESRLMEVVEHTPGKMITGWVQVNYQGREIVYPLFETYWNRYAVTQEAGCWWLTNNYGEQSRRLEIYRS